MMTKRLQRIRSVGIGGLVLAGLFLAGCGVDSREGRPLTTLDPQGSQAGKIQDLVKPVFIVAGVIFVLVEGVILWFMWRYRRRADDVDGIDEPVQLHGNAKLEWTWTIAPAILLAVMAIGNVTTIWALEGDQRDAQMEVEVIGQQWWWEFRYDNNADGQPDIITAQQMVIPAGTTVRVKIRSNDVIHSFWIPALNGKKDAVPGREHAIAIQADKPGIYEGQCTEYCGLSHGYMRMQVKALSEADYAAWVANQVKPAVEPIAGTEAAEGKALFQARCMGCHQIDGYSSDGTLAADNVRPDPDYLGAKHPLTSGNAPNMTHLMSRQRFAGNMFDLYTDDTTAADVSPSGTPNVGLLGDWLRNPGAMKPMAADQNRGMPKLGLSEDEIRKLVAYITLLK